MIRPAAEKLPQRLLILRIINSGKGSLGDVGVAELVRLSFDLDLVVGRQPGTEHLGKDDLIEPAVTQAQSLFPTKVLPTQGLQHLDCRDYGVEVFEVREVRSCVTLHFVVCSATQP